ncbi:MAG: hypothetical protein IPO81_19845 [Kouleothrix sp.]|nr:hypothetical protein [Kouleothrix sp.]
MEQRLFFPAAHLRLLECWLPLAREINQRHGWGYDLGELEALILASAPALARAGTAPEAHGILWYYHLLRRAEAV